MPPSTSLNIGQRPRRTTVRVGGYAESALPLLMFPTKFNSATGIPYHSRSMPIRRLTYRSLERLLKKAPSIQRDLSSIRMIIFSDHHRGDRSAADDFMQCERTYLAALEEYFEQGYELVLLGDVEELWENSIQKTVDSYPEVIAAERNFYLKDRLHRIWGNHDDYWRSPILFQRYFKSSFRGLKVHEGLVLKLRGEDGKNKSVLMAHGHQGSLGSDRFSTISRFFVRVFWRYWQNLSGLKLTQPSNNLRIRSKTDEILYQWAASKENTVLITGHTHQPVFTSRTHLDFLRTALAEATEPALIARLERQIAEKKKAQSTVEVAGPRKPVYFNSGCCSFSDGDITGLEIMEGKISLVRWSSVTKKREVLVSQELSLVQ